MRSREPAATSTRPPLRTRDISSSGAAPAPEPTLSTLRARLRQVEKDMGPLDRSRVRLAARLAEVADHRELASIGAELAGVAAAIEALEERWLELGAAIEARS